MKKSKNNRLDNILTERKRVGIWIRVSTKEQNESDAPETHEKRAENYAHYKDWMIVERYRLCTSGKSAMDHPEAKRMLNDIRSGRIQALIFSKLARLSRDARQLMDISEYFKKYNADMVSLGENFDTSTAAGEMFYNLVAVFAQWERRETSERISAAMLTRAKEGLPVGGVAPFGYKWQDDTLVIDKQEAPTVIEVFNTFIRLKKIKTTASTLNSLGYRTRKGSYWSDTSVRRMLTNTTYIGVHYLNHTKANGKRWRPKHKDEWIPLNVKPIIKKVIWNQANSIIQANSAHRIRRKNIYLLTGLISCTKCGCKMYGYAYGRSKGYYKCQKCTNKIPIQEIEDILIEKLKKFVFRPKDLTGLPKSSLEILQRKLRHLKKVKRETEIKIKETFELYHKKRISNGILANLMENIEKKYENVNKEIPEVKEEIMTKKLKNHKNDISNYMKSIGEIFNSLKFEEQSNLVKDIVESIKVNNNNIYINFYLLNFFKKNMDLLRKFNEKAWVHCRGEHEARRVGQGHFGAPDRHTAVLKRLAQHLDHVFVELG